VGLMLFEPGDDPGPSFSSLLRRGNQPIPSLQKESIRPNAEAFARSASPEVGLRHGTTVTALRFADGVVMAGDRRATEGNLIAHRAMEKVFPADRHSAVAIAGVAGPAVEMVKLFQTQLEHYEKVEGVALSLEGKANQLGQMVREHLPLAMQGLVVVPLYAGYDLRREEGRIFTYDVTGGHFEEADHAATGSGGRDARTTIKLGWRPNLPRDEAIELAVRALYEAADEDSATGGPDLVRGIYPAVATVTSDGYTEVPQDEVAARFASLVEQRDLGRGGGGGSP
jgi:proteasome beta subunit